jgi:aminobenzoyl-glutamate utilization protein B
MDKKRMKEEILAWSAANKEEFYKVSDDIWENPELSMQEFYASALHKATLTKHGFAVEENAGEMPTAFIASWGKGSPVVGFSCEYDALPGLSQRMDVLSKSHRTQGAPGHGCGHNLLGTAGVKAAVALRYAMEKNNIPGTIKVFGTPAEELCLGKPFLGKVGAFKGMDAFIDWHPWNVNRSDYDSCPAYFSVKYHYTGKTCHGNSPWNGRSALDAAMIQAQSTEFLREHIFPGEPPDAANTFNYTFSNTGPEFPSVVPDRASIWYIGRFVTSADAEDAFYRITNCAKGAALATETEVEVEIITMTHHKVPNKVLARCMHDNFVEQGPPKFTDEEQQIARTLQKEVNVPATGFATDILPFGGGFSALCDTSEYSWNAPYVVVFVALAPQNVSWHNWVVNYCAGNSMGKKSMDKAADLMAATGVDIVCDPGLVESARAEFKERLGDSSYRCLLPVDAKPPLTMNAEVMAKYNIDKVKR